MNSRKFFSALTVIMVILSLSISTFAAATKYPSVIGGGNEVYFTTSDGKLYVTQPKSNNLVQVKKVTNVKMAADDVYFGLWVMDKSGYVYYYQDDPDHVGTYPTKKKLDKLGTVKSISIGSEGMYALKTDGSVWGVNNKLQVFKVEGLSGVTSISIKDFDVIALKSDGTVWQWSDDAVIADFAKKKPLTQITALKNVKQISAGASNGLALKKDNTVWQWSFDSEGAPKPVQIKGFTGAKSIEAGRMEGYVIDGAGNVWTWKQWGDKKNSPSKIKGFTQIVSMVASGKDSYDGFSNGRLVAFDKNNKFKIYNVD